MDLNYLFRVPLGETEMLPVWQPGELDRPRVRVVSITELLAGKLLALSTVARPVMFGTWQTCRDPRQRN